MTLKYPVWPFAQTILLICFLVQPQRCLLCYCLFQTQSICIPVYKMGKSFCSVLTTVALLPVLHCSSVPGFWETLCYLEIHRAEPWRSMCIATFQVLSINCGCYNCQWFMSCIPSHSRTEVGKPCPEVKSSHMLAFYKTRITRTQACSFVYKLSVRFSITMVEWMQWRNHSPEVLRWQESGSGQKIRTVHAEHGRFITQATSGC